MPPLTEAPASRSFLFIDESGDARAGSPHDAHRQYLCLCGCIVHYLDHENTVRPVFDRLKHKHIPAHRSRPIFLHRADIMHRRSPFDVLKDPAKAQAFDTDLLTIFRELPYVVIAVVIDKEARSVKQSPHYGDPYHYALALMLERFVGYLKVHRRVGNVVIEARGPNEDRPIEEIHRRIYAEGTSYHPGAFFQARLRSAKPKFRDKKKIVAGLELADLLAHAAKCDVLADNELCGRRPAGTFSEGVENCLAKKYNRRLLTRRVKGYGKVFLTWPPAS